MILLLFSSCYCKRSLVSLFLILSIFLIIEIAGLEYIKDKNGKIYTYDVNTYTNYKSIAEKDSQIKGMKSIAKFLKKELLLLSNIKIVA